jgi:hypothetical protein
LHRFIHVNEVGARQFVNGRELVWTASNEGRAAKL